MCIRDRCITYSIEDSYNDPALVLSQLHLEEPQRRVVKPFDLLEILGNSASGDRTAAVSYTHLDVYKRQEFRLGKQS